MAKCKDCERPIVWATTGDGKHVAFDAEPSKEGRYVILKGVSRLVTSEDVKLLRERFNVHWQTCPDRRSF